MCAGVWAVLVVVVCLVWCGGGVCGGGGSGGGACLCNDGGGGVCVMVMERGTVEYVSVVGVNISVAVLVAGVDVVVLMVLEKVTCCGCVIGGSRCGT